MVPDYIVVTPAYEGYAESNMLAVEPPEKGCDVAYIRNAKDAKQAKWEAYRLWRKHLINSWVADNKLSGEHPLKGVTVERVSESLNPEPWKPFFSDLGGERGNLR